MAQEYEVLQFKAGNFQDNFGNTWCDMALKGVGEPVRIVVKDPTSIHEGDILYGEIKEMTSKANKPYNRFYREQRPEGEDHHVSTTSNPDGGSGNSQSVKKEWQPRDDNAIRAQWAINAALQEYAVLGNPIAIDTDDFMAKRAKFYYDLVGVVKGSSESTDPKVNTPVPGAETATTSTSSDDTTDEEWKSLSRSLDQGVPIEM